MQTFYLRLKDKAVLIGDRDLVIKEGTLFTGKLAGDTLCITRLFEGTEDQCQRLLDWVMGSLCSGVNEYRVTTGRDPLPYVDARKFVAELESEQPD
jgi:hypothetical protein